MLLDIATDYESPEKALRPFDANRNGLVGGEGAGILVFEPEDKAKARGAEILAHVAGFAMSCEGVAREKKPTGKAIAAAIEGAMKDAGITVDDLSHVNATGRSTVHADAIEAQAIAKTLGSDVPVTAPRGYFGSLSAGSGSIEAIASVLSLQKGLIPAVANYETPDPECPINVVAGEPLASDKKYALTLDHTDFGQAVAMVLEKA